MCLILLVAIFLEKYCVIKFDFFYIGLYTVWFEQ